MCRCEYWQITPILCEPHKCFRSYMRAHTYNMYEISQTTPFIRRSGQCENGLALFRRDSSSVRGWHSYRLGKLKTKHTARKKERTKMIDAAILKQTGAMRWPFSIRSIVVHIIRVSFFSCAFFAPNSS